MNSNSTLTIAAILGALGIIIGAFGAHSLPQILSELSETDLLERKTWLETGVRYHMYHVAALMVLALAGQQWGNMQWVSRLWILGVLIFSGCLYAMSLTGIRVLGAVVPLGGLSLMAGWILLAIKSRRLS